MKKLVTKLLCAVMASSFILCGCNQVTETTAVSETESQTEATTTVAETEPAPTESRPEINVDNMIKVADLYESKKSTGSGTVQIIMDGIRGKGFYYVSNGTLYLCYSSLDGLSFQANFTSGKRVSNIRYDFVYKDKGITGVGSTGIETFEKMVDDVVADTAPYINVLDKTAVDSYSENFKKDFPIVYSRFIALADTAFSEIGLKLEDLGIDLGTKYRSVDPKQPTSMEPTVSKTHQFKNGFCTDCKKSWTEIFYGTVGTFGGGTGKGWRSVYGQKSPAMLMSEDAVQYSATDKKYASMLYFQMPEDDNAETETFGIEISNASTKKKKNMKVSMFYDLEMKRFSVGKGVYTPKYRYWVQISAKPGQYDKVFESKESFKKYVKVDLFVTNSKGVGTSAWGKKANISKLKASFEKDGCTYYTKDQIIDKLWEHHDNFLESLDYGMVWMGTSLSDIGVNWAKKN